MTLPALPAWRLARSAGVAATIAALSLAAGPVTAATAPPSVTVEVLSRSYAPTEITVPRGTLVTWQNTTSPSRVHDVVSSIPQVLSSGFFGGGQSWSHRFDAAGTYSYICSIHDDMLGAVHVPLTGRLVAGLDGPRLRIRIATADLAADSPFRFVVLRRDPGNTVWTPWQVTRSAVVEYRPAVAGTYEFVMRLRNVDGGHHTGAAGNSPVLTLEWAT